MDDAGKRALIDKVWSSIQEKDWDQFVKCLQQDGSLRLLDSQHVKGHEAIRAVMEYFGGGYDFKLLDISAIIDGDMIVTRSLVQVTYVRTQPGLPEACNQQIVMPFHTFSEVRSEALSSLRLYYDFGKFMSVFSEDAPIAQ